MELKDLVRQELILLLDNDITLNKLIIDRVYKKKALTLYDMIDINGINRTKLNRLSGMKSEQLTHALKLLTEEGLIEAELIKTATKPKIIYRRIKQ